MGIDVSWHDTTSTIIRYTLRDPWDLDDLQAAIRTGYAMSQGVPGLFIIYDFKDSQRLPPAFFSAITTMRKMKQDDVSMRIAIAAPPFIRTIYNLFTRLAPDLTEDFIFVDDEAQALAVLAEAQAA
ncbi:MAG: hypothetical protein JXN59_13500 [Anaerolineae bacterium]|nr:hypothetical protein [Anaerolineae bacterium]